MIEIREVKTARDLRKFIEFPCKLYKNNPYYVPTLYMDEKNTLREKTNPSYEYCDSRQFLAYKDGKLAGRVCAIINHAFNEKWNRSCIRFNRYDVIDDFEVSKALIEKVQEWGAERGLAEITGPIGFNDTDKQGLLIEGFEEMDLSHTTYNAPYYADHLEKLGFKKDADWIEMQIFIPKELDPTIVKVANGLMRKHKLHVLKAKSMKDIIPRAKEIFDVLNKSYANLYGVVPLTDKQIQSIIDQFLSLLNPDYCVIILNEQDEVIAFGVAAPSTAAANKKCNGKLFPLGWLYLLRALKKNTILELLLIGVLPEYQNWGLSSIILTQVYQNAAKNGILMAETGPELEDNTKVRSTWKNFNTRLHRRRRCYIKTIEK